MVYRPPTIHSRCVAGVGDGSFPATEDKTIRLVRQLAIVEDVDIFRAGDETVDVQL
jgi:hypothetical protein